MGVQGTVVGTVACVGRWALSDSEIRSRTWQKFQVSSSFFSNPTSIFGTIPGSVTNLRFHALQAHRPGQHIDYEACIQHQYIGASSTGTGVNTAAPTDAATGDTAALCCRFSVLFSFSSSLRSSAFRSRASVLTALRSSRSRLAASLASAASCSNRESEQ